MNAESMSTFDEDILDATAREGLAVVAEVLLPGTEKLPSGRSVGCHLALLDRVLRVDGSLLSVLRRVANPAAEQGSCTLQDIVAWAQGDVEEVVRALNLAYFMSTDVMDALGYWGQTRRPVSEATDEEKWDEALLSPVRARGPVYVPTPERHHAQAPAWSRGAAP